MDGWTLVPELIDLAPATGLAARITDGLVSLEIRHLDPTACELSEAGLDVMLYAQNWASPPFDIVRWSGPSATGVGGTYRVAGDVELVREWFLTDGATLLNGLQVGDTDVIRQRAAACDDVMWSIRFESSAAD